MTPAEVARLLEGAELATTEGRNALRDRFLRLYLAGRMGSGHYRDLVATLDSAARDKDMSRVKPSAPLVVEVQRFGPPNGAGR